MKRIKQTQAPPIEAKSTDQIQHAPQFGFIRQTELLKRLQISRRTLTNWRKSGKIPTIRVGATLIFCWDSVTAALKRLEQ